MAQPRLNTSWIGQTVGGRYQIESLLGQGGMSSVYKATDPNLQRAVAIKLIHPHLSSDPEFVRRFEQEAAAVAQLRHPNIIQVYDFNHDGDLYYMVLEHVPGETLQSRLATLDATSRQLPLADSASIIATVCEAVAYAHKRGMIHRDLKPANVMLTPAGQPILMDFGVAKMLGGTHHTATGAIVGTAKYMSPEQARGDRPDERTDIYSLGVMLYEMVAGQPPFDADTTVAVLMQHVTQPVPNIRQIRKDVPDKLVAVVEKALQKKPADRYQAASEMAAALGVVAAEDQTMTVTGEDLDSTMLVAAGQRKRVAAAGPKPVAAPKLARPAAKPVQSGGRILWIIGAVAALLVMAVGVGAIFWFSGSAGSAADTEGEIAAAITGQGDLPSAEGMVRIKADTYQVGLDASDSEHVPAQQVNLDEFWIDRYEITNAHYAGFVAGTGGAPPADWPDGNIPADLAAHPVMGVTWEQAAAYCEWAGKRLPAEAEWEVAARGLDGRLYPWGNDPRAVELPRSGTYAIGGKPTNQTPSGLFDMAGNVWEWVGEPYAPVEAGHRILRGGANGFVKDLAYRLHGDPNTPTMFAAAGIRCAASQVADAPAQDAQLAEGVLYLDTFADPGSGWPVLAENSEFFGYHPPDFYHIELGKPDSHTAITRPPDFDDVTIESEVRTDSTDSENGNFRYGLILRRMSADKYYAFVVSYRAGTWQVFKSSPAGLETLAEGPVDSLRGFAPPGFTPDQSDGLRVDAKGDDFAFHINGTVVAKINDGDYDSGESGFYVETFNEPRAHVHFDSLTIRQVDTGAFVLTAPNTSEPPAVAPTEPPTSEPPPAPTATAEPAAPTPISDSLPAQPVTEEPATPTEVPATEPAPTLTSTPEPPPPTAAAAQPEVPAGMVLISTGTFIMGSSGGQPDEAPPHEISLDAYFIDKFEVSNANYRQCVTAGGCSQTGSPDAFTRPGYRDDPNFNNHPVINVTWDQAAAYCRWAGKRLPTEAEWEYAARGEDSLTWPWGDTFNVGLTAAGSPDTQAVDSFPGGASQYGVLNLAGNVNEWVQDVYSANFYANSPAANPVNDSGGNERVFRGGSFANPDSAFYTASRRYHQAASFNDVDIGFRCALDLP